MFLFEMYKADVYVSQFWWQIVPDSGSGNRKVTVAETVLCSWDNACSVVGWSKETPSAVSEKLDIIGHVLGAWLCSDLYMIQASLNRTRWRTGSQCNLRSTGLMCSCRLAPVISRAARVLDCLHLRIKLSATPYISEFTVIQPIQATRNERLD